MRYGAGQTMGGHWASLRSSSLLVNALYLMLGTAAVAVLGFVFWILITRTYSTATVGLAATILSVSGLLSLLSLAGFDTTFVRFLPKAVRPNEHITAGMLCVGIVAAVISIGCVLALPAVAPSLAFIRHDAWYALAFIGFTVITSLNTLTNAVFLAAKRARPIFVINALFSLVKVLLPLWIVNGTAMTIFVIVGVSQLCGLALSLLWMYRGLGYRFSLGKRLRTLQGTGRYSLSVYGASVLNLLPPTILPLLILHQLGAENAAYYYIAFTVAGALYTIAYAAMQSVFAEGSHDSARLWAHARRASMLIGLLLIPAVVVVVGFGSYILGLFGQDYSAEAITLLRLFALSAIPVALYSGLGAVFKVTNNLLGIIAMNITYTAVILGASTIGMASHGVQIVGWAWGLGNLAAVVVGLLCLQRVHKRKKE